jgi:hypothetical protein
MRACVYLISFVALLFTGCAGTPKQARLVGLSETALVAKLGSPAVQREFPMSDAKSMFRVRLQMHYSLPESSDVRIREMTWEFGDDRLTCWLHRAHGEWQVLETTKYTRWTVF